MLSLGNLWLLYKQSVVSPSRGLRVVTAPSLKYDPSPLPLKTCVSCLSVCDWISWEIGEIVHLGAGFRIISQIEDDETRYVLHDVTLQCLELFILFQIDAESGLRVVSFEANCVNLSLSWGCGTPDRTHSNLGPGQQTAGSNSCDQCHCQSWVPKKSFNYGSTPINSRSHSCCPAPRLRLSFVSEESKL